MRLIVGLGNPGAEYDWTRHNLGFLVVDRIAEIAGTSIKRKDCRALLGRAAVGGETVELVKPQTFMNLSGETVACLFGKNDYAADRDRMIVITDDLALPLGSIRLRAKGSAGGHNGLKSIIGAIKTENFIRLRIGIQPAHPISNTKNFVLEKFSAAERQTVEEVLEKSAEAVRRVIEHGVEKAMAEFN